MLAVNKTGAFILVSLILILYFVLHNNESFELLLQCFAFGVDSNRSQIVPEMRQIREKLSCNILGCILGGKKKKNITAAFYLPPELLSLSLTKYTFFELPSKGPSVEHVNETKDLYVPHPKSFKDSLHNMSSLHEETCSAVCSVHPV